MLYIFFGTRKLTEKINRGVENVIKSHINYLLSKNCDILYFFISDEIEISKIDGLIQIGVNPLNLKHFFILNKILNKKKGSFIHSHNYLFSFLTLRRINLMTVHDALGYQFTYTRGPGKKVLAKLIEVFTYLKTNQLIFISKFSKNKSLYQGKNFIILPNSTHHENLLEEERIKIPFNKEEYILVVKNFEERSGYSLIAEVAIKSNLNFVFVGEGPEFENIKARITNHQNIYLTGLIPDEQVKFLYQNCRFTINVALYGEGFGLPIIESYWYNKQCLASNTCAIPEIIKNPNHLFENNIDSIHSLVISIYHSDTNGISYRKYYEQNFSLAVLSKRLKMIYEI